MSHRVGAAEFTGVRGEEIDYLFLTKATSTTWAFFLIERNDLETTTKKKETEKV